MKTTAIHPQANGNIERMHFTLTNLIKTAFPENSKEWDENIKFINFSINTMRNETTGFSPYELTFGRDPNIPSTIPNSPTLTLQDVIKKWKSKHDESLEKAKRRMKIVMEKTKKRLDDNILRKYPLYKGQYVKIIKKSKDNRLDPSWKGPFKIIQVLPNNNLIIQARNKTSQIHMDNAMPYFTDDVHDQTLLVLATLTEVNFTLTLIRGNIYVEEISKVYLFHKKWKLIIGITLVSTRERLKTIKKP